MTTSSSRRWLARIRPDCDFEHEPRKMFAVAAVVWYDLDRSAGRRSSSVELVADGPKAGQMRWYFKWAIGLGAIGHRGRSSGTENMKHCAITALFVLFAVSGCGKSTPDTLIKSGYDEQEMDAAISRARSEVDSFVSELSKPTGTNHAVKAPVEDAGKTEHFWLTDVSYKNGEFKGTINNDPGIVGNVKVGQSWSIKKTEISDWMFMRDGKMYGNYTMRPLLKTMPENEAAKYRSILAEP